MKSSSGVHLVGLDHVRALAVFLVFAYHFLVAAGGPTTQLEGADGFFANALLAEGHTGVALFMTLSGYLFARLTEGRRLSFRPFIRNRVLRLAPLMALVIAVRLAEYAIFEPEQLPRVLTGYVAGFIGPYWPNGGWSITTELHFYLLLPLLLLVAKRDPRWLLLVVAGAIAARAAIWAWMGGEVLQPLAYWTIAGRIDQFVLGIVAARCGAWLAGRHLLAGAVAIGWLLLWSAYARIGGFYSGGGAEWLWIGLTTAEGVAYAVLIAWYDRSFRMPSTGVSGAAAKIGEWSFAIYLLHFFLVDAMARFMMEMVPSRDFGTVLLLSLPCFALTALVGRLVYELFEKRFLSRRVPYLEPVCAGRCAERPHPERCGQCGGRTQPLTA